MITVNGVKSDYAIMKQVQQIQRSGQHAIVPLDSASNYSTIGKQETLYIVSHGNAANGRLRDVATMTLVRFLTGEKYRVPEVFGGIVILSCYSGERIRKTTLVEDLATQLKGLVATGTTVAGADGYSFGTKEFQSTGRSSVLSRKLASFYFLADTAGMQNEWLAHRPTHPDGILKTQFSINVDTQKTIGEQLQGMLASRGAPRANKAAQDEALGCVTSFTKKADAIQKELERIIALIPGDTVAARADYFANNTGNANVTAWNAAIDQQYELF